ncbi:MAG: histidine kinase N-terminal 7TM domain-containing protein [Candidatus Margulisiibacteriota bacterium]
MSPFIFFYCVSLVLAGLASLCLGIYVRHRAPDTLGKLYFFSTLSLFIVALSSALARGASSENYLYLIEGTLIFGWCLLFALYLNMSMFLANVRSKFLPAIYVAAFLMFAIFNFTPNYIVGFEKEFYGYSYIRGSWHSSFIVFFLVYLLAGFFLLVFSYRTRREFYRREQAMFMILSSIFPIVFGTLSDQILIILKLPFFPMALHSIALTIGLFGYAIIRYTPMRQVSQEKVAEAAAEALLDAIFLVDKSDIINYVNLAACRMTGLRNDELLGMHIDHIFPQNNAGITILKGKKNKTMEVELKVLPLASGHGTLYLAKGLSRIVRSRDAIKKTVAKQDLLIKKEKTIIGFLFRFLETRDAQKINRIWQEVQYAGQEIAAVLEPVHDLALQHAKALDEASRARDELMEKNDSLNWLNKILSNREITLNKLEEEYNNLRWPR